MSKQKNVYSYQEIFTNWEITQSLQITQVDKITEPPGEAPAPDHFLHAGPHRYWLPSLGWEWVQRTRKAQCHFLFCWGVFVVFFLNDFQTWCLHGELLHLLPEGSSPFSGLAEGQKAPELVILPGQLLSCFSLASHPKEWMLTNSKWMGCHGRLYPVHLCSLVYQRSLTNQTL